MKLFYSLVVIVFLAAGCGRSFSDGQGVTQKNLDSDVVIETLEGNEVGEYQVRFYHRKGASFSIIKHDLLNDSVSEIAVNVSDDFIDEEVVSGETYRYEVGQYEEDKSFNTFVIKEVRIPLDINLSRNESKKISDFDLGETTEGHRLLSVNRIVLGDGSRLLTEGLPTYIKANKLFSSGGEIETFEEGSTATNGSSGLSGNLIYLSAEYAKGDVKIILRGQNGGPGIRPAPLGLEGKGIDSAATGTWGESSRDIYVPYLGDEIIEREKCDKQPGPGGTGGRGKKGLKGGAGGSGGNTGRASIEIKENDFFEVSFDFIPGVGGAGSKGGEGGPGGDGGPTGGEILTEYVTEEDGGGRPPRPKKLKNPDICNRNPGKQGPKGPIGEPGDQGANGINEVICIKLSEESETNCFKENI